MMKIYAVKLTKPKPRESGQKWFRYVHGEFKAAKITYHGLILGNLIGLSWSIKR